MSSRAGGSKLPAANGCRATRTMRPAEPIGSVRASAIVTLILAVVAATLCSPALSAPQAANNRQQPSPAPAAANQRYYGSFIGKLIGRQFNISGEVYAVDEQTLFIKSFTNDGQAQDAYFWSSVSSPHPSADGGFIVPDEKGSTKPLERYANKDIVLRLPEGRTLREIAWFSIWSRSSRQSAADVTIGRQLVIPRPLEIGPLSQLAHGVKSAPITIVDAQTFLVPDFHYDGLGPDGYFWLARGGQGLAANGLRLKDESGSSSPLRKYAGETVVISLPDDATIYDFDYFGVWCREYQVNFGQTRIPQSAKVPPSPKMLGIKPENKLNCEILYDDLGYEIRWVLDGDDIVMQLVGKIEPGEYMAFGLGKDDSKSDMKDADAVVTWVDRPSGQVHAIDYFLGAKAQCANDPRGSCPDLKMPGGGDSLTLLHGAIVNGYSMVTFKRPQLGVDDLYDQHVYSDGQQSVLWAIGVLNGQKEIGYHRLHSKGNMFIDFARNPQWNCPIPDLNASMHGNLPVTSASQMDPQVVSAAGNNQESAASDDAGAPLSGPVEPSGQRQTGTQAAATTRPRVAASQPDPSPWFIPSIICPTDKTFHAQIGPTGGPKRGYEGLTGRPSLGVAWYINGMLIPELVVERGSSYRFIVEGGSDKTSTTRRHPFYLTDSQEGGFDFKTDEGRQRERIFAGVALRGDGQFVPTAEGRLCEWRPTNSTLANADLYPTFSAYQRSLKLDCLAGQASMLKFVPDTNTPDTIYYQCYTHQFMGWRIKVVDSCRAYVDSMTRAATSGWGTRTRTTFEDNQEENQTNKRDTTLALRSTQHDQVASGSEPIPAFNRRQSWFEGQNLIANSVQPSDHLSFDANFSDSISSLLPSEFGDDPSASSPAEFTSTELSTIPSDMLIVNASQLLQKQPVNLSMLEQILKFSPNDLEIIDGHNIAQNQLTGSAQGLHSSLLNNIPTPPHAFGMSFRNITPDASGSHQSTRQMKVMPSVKSPKSLQSYMRRLASLYYPVQQQLASVLSGHGASNSGNGAASSNQQSVQNNLIFSTTPDHKDPMPSAPSEQSSSFSLSNLVPKPKIDLSKTNLSKKFSRLRIKSGRKYEPSNGAKKLQPPIPANEFNYDIFNNQLAQLDKQQKQLQSLESMASSLWTQASMSGHIPGESVDYMPFLPSPNEDPRHLYQSPPPTIDDLQSASQMIAGGGNNLINVERYPMQSEKILMSGDSNNYAPNHHAPRPEQPRLSTIPLGPQTPFGQQPRVTDYFSMIFNTSSGRPNGQQQPASNSQHAVFITRLPPNQVQGYLNQQPQPWPHSDDSSSSVRYPSVQPYSQPTSQAVGNGYPQHYQQIGSPDDAYYKHDGMGLSTMPSVPMSTHESKENNNRVTSANPEGGFLNQDHTESNSVFYQQNQPQQPKGSQTSDGDEFDSMQTDSSSRSNNQNSNQVQDSDHMLAIERFSKQSSERQPPSIVHPITGEQVQFAASDQAQSANNTVRVQTNGPGAPPQRFSNILIDEHIMSSTLPTIADLLDANQSVQVMSELRRLNSSVRSQLADQYSPSTPNSNDINKIQRTGSSLTNYANGMQQNKPKTTTQEPVSSTLARPLEVLEYYKMGAPVVTTMPTLSMSPTQVPPAPGVGPLVPSVGPPFSHSFVSNSDELILKSTLVEPAIVSTLVQTPSNPPHHQLPTQQPFVSRFKFDSNPFRPIELTNQNSEPSSNLANQQEQLHDSASNMMTNRLRPSPLVESMLNQYITSQVFKPEPPVQVASYLAQHLAGHQHNHDNYNLPVVSISSEKSPISTKPVALNIALQHQNINTSVAGSMNKTNQASSSSNELIVLKPALIPNSQSSKQTYALKPEYMTNQFKILGTLSADSSVLNTIDSNDLYSSSSDHLEPAHRLAGHQFDRLSSLSSPPSTSIALDPMQSAHTITSFVKQTKGQNDNHGNQDSSQQVIDEQSRAKRPKVNETSPIVTQPSKTYSSDVTANLVPDASHLAQHRQTMIPSKPIPLAAFSSAASASAPETSDVMLRPNPGGDNINTLPRDNNTDNAILSHVMSLITSNAIPAPPLVPMASYSNADYFIPSASPTNDRLVAGSMFG